MLENVENVFEVFINMNLQFIYNLYLVRLQSEIIPMLLSDVANVDHMRRRLHKSRYMVSNAHKLIGSINIPPTPKNVSSGVLEPCNNCRTT